MRNPESKLDGNEGVLYRKNITVSQITHIGKESNNLDKVQTFGADLNSYVVYEDRNDLERRFVELSLRILKLEPKDVKKFGISRQTLWNIKKKIILKQISKVSRKVKITLMNLLIID
jgi:outer membrane lipoprotein-sorting protein